MIGTKQVEFKMYEPLPHLACPVVKGADGGIDALKYVWRKWNGGAKY